MPKTTASEYLEVAEMLVAISKQVQLNDGYRYRIEDLRFHLQLALDGKMMGVKKYTHLNLRFLGRAQFTCIASPHWSNFFTGENDQITSWKGSYDYRQEARRAFIEKYVDVNHKQADRTYNVTEWTTSNAYTTKEVTDSLPEGYVFEAHEMCQVVEQIVKQRQIPVSAEVIFFTRRLNGTVGVVRVDWDGFHKGFCIGEVDCKYWDDNSYWCNTHHSTKIIISRN